VPTVARPASFLRTPKGKEPLRPALAPGNVEKTMSAPVTAIIAYDLLFFEKTTEAIRSRGRHRF